jgi:hypothetical protein
MRFLFGFFTIALTISLSSPVLAYKEIPVSNGGTISGKVVLTGEEPPPLAFSLVINNNTEFCGRISTGTGWRLVDEFHVAPDGGLQNAVVFLEGIHQGKPFPETQPAQVVVEDCLFSPWLLVVRDSQPIHIKNMDPIIHDVQLYETAPFGAKVMLHRPLRLNPFHPKDLLKDHLHNPGETMIDTMQFTQGRRTFFLECGFHAYMQTWGLAVTNPYYAVTDEQGNFTLPDIPEGVYKMVAWHPGMAGFLDMKVVVLSNDTMKVRMEFPEPRDRRMAHTTMSPSYRFDTRALEREGAVIDIQVTHEDQDIRANTKDR